MNLKRIEAFKELVERLPIRGRKRLVQNYLRADFLEDKEGMEMLESQVKKISLYQERVSFPIPNPGLEGEISLGENYDYKYNLTLSELNQHLLITGRTGAGKTNLNYRIMKQLYDLKIPFWVFDFKQDYRKMKAHVDLRVFQEFKFNPLRPPEGVDPIRWIQVFSSAFGHSFSLMQGAMGFLMESIHKLYELYDVEHQNQNYPSIQELKELLDFTRLPLSTRDARYLEAVRNRINTIVISTDLDCDNGLEDLLQENVVFELHGLHESVQNFLSEIMMCWIFMYRMNRGERGKLLHATFCDEGRRIFDRNKERNPALGIPTIDILTSQIREFGEALIVSDQEPSKLTDSIKANSYAKILFNLGSSKDVYDMGRCMGLSAEQMQECSSLGVGEAIVKLSDRYTDPFLIKTGKFEIKNVGNNVVEKWEGKPKVRPPAYEEYIMNMMAGRKEALKKKKQEEEEEKFLQSIQKEPFLTITERYQKLNFSTRNGSRIKNQLLDQEKIKEVEINLGRSGGRRKLLELTEQGMEKLGTTSTKRFGGSEHKFWINEIKRILESQGHECVTEYPVGNKKIDLLVDGRTAIEVEMSSRHALENIKKCKDFELIVLCKNEEVLGQVRKLDKNITLRLIKDFLNDLEKNKGGVNTLRLG